MRYRYSSVVLRTRLCLEEDIFMLQRNRLRWYDHVLRRDGGEWVRRHWAYEVEGIQPTQRR